MTLFDTFNRVDLDPARNAESTFDYLNRSARPAFGNVRRELEKWFANFPDESKADVRGRFRSKKRSQCLPAYWELYLHEVHLRLGFEIERDPTIPGKRSTPDFLMTKAGRSFLLEATVVGYSDAEAAARQRQSQVLDLVNEAFNPDFCVHIEIERASDQLPVKREIVRPLEEWLAGLDWEKESEKNVPIGRNERTLFSRGWTLKFNAIAKGRSSRGDRDYRTIGIGPSDGGMIAEDQNIVSDLREKARKYGDPDEPFVLGLLCLRDFARDHDFEEALFGQEVVQFATGENRSTGKTRISRDPNGLWTEGAKPAATRVSAVLAAVHLMPWSVGTSTPTLWENPWANHPVASRLPWENMTANLETNRFQRIDRSLSGFEIFGLPNGWPGPN